MVALHVASHRPSTHDEPDTAHCVPSEQRSTCGAHVPSMHLAPSPPHSPSALHGTRALDASAASLLVPESTANVPESTADVPESTAKVAESPANPESPWLPPSTSLRPSTPASPIAPPTATHWASPFDSLQTYPPGQPFTLQSPASSPGVDATHCDWSLQTYPSSQSVFCEHCQLMQAPEYEGSGQL